MAAARTEGAHHQVQSADRHRQRDDRAAGGDGGADHGFSSAGIDFAASQRKTKRLVEFEGVACDVLSPATEASPKPDKKTLCEA